VVLARYVSPRLRDWIEEKLEGWLKLQINRDKTRVLDLRQASTAARSVTGILAPRAKRRPENGTRCER